MWRAGWARSESAWEVCVGSETWASCDAMRTGGARSVSCDSTMTTPSACIARPLLHRPKWPGSCARARHRNGSTAARGPPPPTQNITIPTRRAAAAPPSNTPQHARTFHRYRPGWHRNSKRNSRRRRRHARFGHTTSRPRMQACSSPRPLRVPRKPRHPRRRLHPQSVLRRRRRGSRRQ